MYVYFLVYNCRGLLNADDSVLVQAKPQFSDSKLFYFDINNILPHIYIYI